VGFNPRARVGRDESRGRKGWVKIKFQSTRPRGARHDVFIDYLVKDTFQSTRPRGARPTTASAIQRCGSFNPRARVGRDLAESQAELQMLVSIHAPAWGATELEEVCAETGASFNPRARVGRDMVIRFVMFG